MTLFDTTTTAAPFAATLDCLRPRGLVLSFTSAGVSSARRYIAATVLDQDAGRIGACPWYSLRVDVKEDRPWGSEVTARVSRRPTHDSSYRWTGLTDRADKIFDHELAVELHRYGGFDKAWRAAWVLPRSQTYTGATDAVEQATRLRRLAQWWDDVADLAAIIDMHGDEITYVHVPTPIGKHPLQQLRPSGRGDVQWAHMEVRIEAPDGTPLGWLDPDGKLLPLHGVKD